MAQTTIEWTVTYNEDGTSSPGYTFNPWLGCTKVSDGCKHCYAETLMDKRFKRVKWGPAGRRERTSAANWRKPLAWNKEAKEQGRRAKVFCASLADVFEDKPDQPEMAEWRDDLFSLIGQTPYLDWLLLTKRPENVHEMIERSNSHSYSDAGMWFYAHSNVWIGTSVETQESGQ
jgi:protein gp37